MRGNRFKPDATTISSLVSLGASLDQIKWVKSLHSLGTQWFLPLHSMVDGLMLCWYWFSWLKLKNGTEGPMEVFIQMRENNLQGNYITMISLLGAFSCTQDLTNYGMPLHAYMFFRCSIFILSKFKTIFFLWFYLFFYYLDV